MTAYYSKQVPASMALQYSVMIDTDGIKTSIATSAIAVSYSGADLNGAIGSATKMRVVGVTSSAVPGQYNTTNPIVFTGLAQDFSVRTEEVYLTLADGGETVSTTTGFLSVTSIDVPAQLGGAGAFEFGVSSAVFDKEIRGVYSSTGGDVTLRFKGAYTSTLTLAANSTLYVYADSIRSIGTTALPLIALL